MACLLYTSANRILTEAGVNPDTRCRDLTDEEVKKISSVIDETQVVEGDLRREIALNIKRLQEIGCYRGIRHRKGLPVRGQKTKTNARTRKEMCIRDSYKFPPAISTFYGLLFRI